jgi:hypothetical protein
MESIESPSLAQEACDERFAVRKDCLVFLHLNSAKYQIAFATLFSTQLRKHEIISLNHLFYFHRAKPLCQQNGKVAETSGEHYRSLAAFSRSHEDGIGVKTRLELISRRPTVI